MNTRYLFRGKCKTSNKWLIGNLITNCNNTRAWIKKQDLVSHGIFYETRKEAFEIFQEIDPKTIGQCTGLKDKNGNLIFEGENND